MASQLTAIYAALGAWTFSISIGGVAKSVTALWGDSLTNQIPAARLPARVLAPMENAAEGEGLQLLTFGTTSTGRVDWIIRDILLLKPTTQGQGLPEVSAQLVQYAQDYATKLQTARRVLSTPSKATIIRAGILPGVIEWPVNSEVFYQGVECALTITEVF